MPTVVKCGGCGRVLEEWETMPAPEYYDELYQKLEGHCPSCGHTLPKPRALSRIVQVQIRRASGE